MRDERITCACGDRYFPRQGWIHAKCATTQGTGEWRKVRGSCFHCGKEARTPASFYCDDCFIGSRPVSIEKAVRNAVKSGALADPKKCRCADCGKPATEYDHRDYNKPLEVDPVCHRCNMRRGPAIPFAGRPSQQP